MTYDNPTVYGVSAAMVLHEELVKAAMASVWCSPDVAAQHRESAVRWLHETANAMGFRLVPMEQEAAA
jgi:hypothetical protein